MGLIPPWIGRLFGRQEEIQMFSQLSRGLIAVCVLASTAIAQVQTAPLEVQGAQLAHRAVRDVALGQRIRIENLQVPGGTVALDLHRITVLTADAQLVLGTKDGFSELPRPEVVMLSGSVVGDPDAPAYIAISPYGTNGFVEFAGELVSISTGPYAQEKDLSEALRTAKMSEVTDPANGPEICGYVNGDTALEPNGPMNDFVAPAKRGGASECRIASIAVDTDSQYTARLFGGNTSASAAYAISLMGAISEIYERDLNVRLAVPYLRVWGDNSDPYDTSGDPLDQVQAEWTANMGSVDRTLVHYLTGRQDTSYGGVAYLSVLCNTDYGYGVSAHLDGSFPYPLVDHNAGNWDVVVAAHEMGHNFGTSHTHNYSPVIDGCGNGDCSSAFGGTIMSYCHSCSGGLTNTVLNFHPRVIDVILGYIDGSSCDLGGVGVSAVDDAAQTVAGTPVQIDALGNDEGASCESIALASFDAVSANGGSVSLLSGAGPGGRDMLQYTPPVGFGGDDSFDYTISGQTGSQSATVTIDVLSLLAGVNRISPIDGLGVRYYALGALEMLPDFDALEPMGEDVSMEVNYASTSGNFMNSGRADDVGAVFEGYFQAVFPGVYTFTTNSDDGSKLLIGGQTVVNNDGLHGMQRVGGSIGLEAGWHPIRIEFFERGGGAGLIATGSGPFMPETELGGAFISHESNAACSAADFTSDGVLDIFDVFAFLDAFNAGDPSADFTGDGAFDIFDVFGFLDVFNAGCP